jgi:hypothetical protein
LDQELESRKQETEPWSSDKLELLVFCFLTVVQIVMQDRVALVCCIRNSCWGYVNYVHL